MKEHDRFCTNPDCPCQTEPARLREAWVCGVLLGALVFAALVALGAALYASFAL